MTGIGALMVLAAAAWIIAAPDRGTLVASRGAAGAVAAAGKAAAGQLRSDLGGSRSSGGPSWLTTTRTGRLLGRLGGLVRAGARGTRVAGRAVLAGAAAAPAGWSRGVERAASRRSRYGWPADLVRGRLGSVAQAAGPADADRTGQPESPMADSDRSGGDQATLGPQTASAGPADPSEQPDRDAGPDRAGEADRVDDWPGPWVTRSVRLPDGRVLTVPVDLGPARGRYERTLSPEQLVKLRLLSAIRDSGYRSWLDHDLRPLGDPDWPASDAVRHERVTTGAANRATGSDADNPGASRAEGPLEPGTEVCLVDDPSRVGVVIGYAAHGRGPDRIWVMTVEWAYGEESRHTRDELIVLSTPDPDPVLAVVDEHGDVLWQRQAVCPECGEPAQPVPPLYWLPSYGPRPGWSHMDGEQLCPVMGEDGYQPAEPVPADPTEPGLPRRVGGLGWADLPGSGPLRLLTATNTATTTTPAAEADGVLNSPAPAGVSTTSNPSKENATMSKGLNSNTSGGGDVQPISRGDLDTIDDLALEVSDARSVAEVADAYLAALAEWATSLADRYAGASFRTGGLSRAVSELLEAIPQGAVLSALDDAMSGVDYEIRQAEALSEAAETLDAEGDLAAFRRG